MNAILTDWCGSAHGCLSVVAFDSQLPKLIYGPGYQYVTGFGFLLRAIGYWIILEPIWRTA